MISDGTVDCFDEGIDDQSCFDLGINKCGNDEFRYHNGLCISQEFWKDDEGEIDCLHRSDRTTDTSYINIWYRDPNFLYDEHSCRIDSV